MSASTFCCVVLPLILAIIVGILNSDHPAVNDILVTKLLSRFETGVLCLDLKEENRLIAFGELPSNIEQGSVLQSKKDLSLCTNTLIVTNKAGVYSGFLRGTIGIGETYFRKDWTFDSSKYDLGDIITHIFWNVLNTAGPYTGYLSYFSKYEWQEYFYRVGLTKDQSQDMEDVCYTYFDHQFYEKMLDESMTYTCGLWNPSIETLFDSQTYKLDLLTYKMGIERMNQKTANILDAGSGWGYLTSYIHNKSKTVSTVDKFNVTGITISRDQHAYAQRMFGNHKNTKSPYYYLMDFRELPNVYPPNFFDGIISVGVISHIHSLRLDEWFNVLYKALKPGGLFVMQGIVGTTAFANGNPAWTEAKHACKSRNFIYKYIFPGGCVLLSDWMHESAVKAGFITMHRDFVGQHYSRTLREWRFNMNKHKKHLVGSGIVEEKKYLSYDMYLAQAEALYRTGKIEKGQFVFYKPLKDDIHKHPFEVYQDEVRLGYDGFDRYTPESRPESKK